jgi:hypothetical protein
MMGCARRRRERMKEGIYLSTRLAVPWPRREGMQAAPSVVQKARLPIEAQPKTAWSWRPKSVTPGSIAHATAAVETAAAAWRGRSHESSGIQVRTRPPTKS